MKPCNDQYFRDLSQLSLKINQALYIAFFTNLNKERTKLNEDGLKIISIQFVLFIKCENLALFIFSIGRNVNGRSKNSNNKT
jgi:hypothetical protein